MALLPIHWERGVQDSRVQGSECLSANDFNRVGIARNKQCCPSHLRYKAKPLTFWKLFSFLINLHALLIGFLPNFQFFIIFKHFT